MDILDFNSLNRKNLCFSLGYPNTSNKNKPKGGPLETRAIILTEILRGPVSRVELKERMKRKYNLSTKAIDYHVHRAHESLSSLKVIREKQNRIVHNISTLERLVSTLEILQAYPVKGDVIRDSVHSAYAKCFVSTFGNGLLTIPQGLIPNMHETFTSIEESNGIIPRNRIEELIKISEFVGMHTDIRTEVSYIVTVMTRILEIKRCYSEMDREPSGESKGADSHSSMPFPCELWMFTDSYSKPIDTIKWGKAFSFLYPRIISLLFYRLIVEPLFLNRFEFRVVDRKLGINGEEVAAIHLVGMLTAKSGNDFNKDLYWDPFKDQTIKRITMVEKWVSKNAQNLKEFNALEKRANNFIFEEYYARRLKLIEEDIVNNDLSRELIENLFKEGKTNKHYI